MVVVFFFYISIKRRLFFFSHPIKFGCFMFEYSNLFRFARSGTITTHRIIKISESFYFVLLRQIWISKCLNVNWFRFYLQSEATGKEIITKSLFLNQFISIGIQSPFLWGRGWGVRFALFFAQNIANISMCKFGNDQFHLKT